jgi:hypothetical protein
VVRFSDFLGRGDDDDSRRSESAHEPAETRDLTHLTPTEPVPTPPSEPPPPPPPRRESASSTELLDQLTNYASSRPPAPPMPDPDRSRFVRPSESDVPPPNGAPDEPVPTPYIDSLAPVDDDLLPNRRR